MPAPLAVYIALGSNLGDSEAVFAAVLPRLQELSATPLRASKWLRTTPVDCPPGSPDFLNGVVEITPLPGETPESLLVKLQALERAAGRRPKQIHNEPRPLDLDLIVFGGEIRNTPALILPHPRAHTRWFVAAPLAELNPALILPGHSKSIAAYLQDLAES